MLRLIPLILLLAACQRAGDETGPGGVTIGEAKAVEDAAAMLPARDEAAAQPGMAEKK